MAKNRILPFGILLGLALSLGLIGGLATVLFIELIELVHKLMWDEIPETLEINNKIYIVLVPTLAGIFVGWAHKHLGPYPEGLMEAFARFEKNKAFDYKHIWQSLVVSVVVLGAGVALGPEAALIAIVGGLGSWIASRLSRSKIAIKNINLISISAIAGAVFEALFLPVVLEEESRQSKSRLDRMQNVIAGLIAAGSAFYIVRQFARGGGYFNYNYLPYEFDPTDIFWAVVAATAAVCAGLVFVFTFKVVEKLAKKYRLHPVRVAAASGLVFGLLATTSGLFLFSGHAGIQQIIDTYGSTSGEYLVVVGLVKAFVASLLLATFWKGGRFFPLMFAGAAVGLGTTHFITAIDPMVGLAAGISATLAFVVKKPLLVMLLLVFILPVNLVAFMAVGAGLGSQLARFSAMR